MRLLADHPHDFYHLPGYVAMSAGPDDEPIGFQIREGDNELFLPLVIRPIPGSDLRDATSPYGYPGPLVRCTPDEAGEEFVQDAMAALVHALSQRGLVSCFVRLHPLLLPSGTALASVGLLQRHGSTVSVDLTQTEGSITHDIRKSHRYEIRRAYKEGQRPSMDEGWAYFDDFYELYNETMHRIGADPSYFFARSYYEDLREALGRRLHIGVVKIDGRVAAAALFTETAGLVQYHLSGARTEFVQKRPTKVLLHHAIFWAKERGNRDFHLGGGVGSAEDSLFRFKAGFSKRRHPFFTWRAVTDAEAYRALTPGAAESRGVDDLSGFFPRYRSG